MKRNWSYRLVWGDEEYDLPPGEITLGRSRSCDVSVSDPSVSRRHVFLRMESGEVVLQDLGSSNGTFIDGGRVRGTTRIGDGAELRLGDARLFLRVREAAEKPDPPRPRLVPQPSVEDGAPALGALPEDDLPETERETTKLVEGGPDAPSLEELAAREARAREAREREAPAPVASDEAPVAEAPPPRAERQPSPRNAVGAFDSRTLEPGIEASPKGGRGLRIVAALGAAFLGLVLLVAAWVKAIDPEGFARQIQTEGLDFLFPAAAVALIGIAVELLLGSLLVLGVRRLPVLVASTGLVVFFVFLTGRTWWLASRGELPADVGCGCFGNLVQRTPAEAFWQDLLLMVPALALAWLVRPGVGRPAFLRTRLGVASLVTVAGLLLAWKAPELPLDDLATRLAPGAEIADLCAGGEEARVCLDGVAPELQTGDHLVVLADLDESFVEAVPALDTYHLADRTPPLMVLAAVTPEELFAFRFGQGAAVEIHEAPGPLLRPLYRTLPRSFLVRDGLVVETWPGLPPAVTSAP